MESELDPVASPSAPSLEALLTALDSAEPVEAPEPALEFARALERELDRE